MKRVLRLLPRAGCVATGVLYGGVGIIALLSFYKVRDGGADESSMIAILNHSIIGGVVIWILLLASVGYIIWRIFESLTDPYHYGKSLYGRLTRTGVALSSLADMLIGYAIVKVMFGIGGAQVNGEPVEERDMARQALDHSWGQTALIVFGCVVMVVAAIQFIYGVTEGYHDRMKLSRVPRIVVLVIKALALSGHSARGIILGIIGYFLILAGVKGDAERVVNTDKAFDFIGDHVGHTWFVVIAICTICYGLFMLTLGVLYNHESKKEHISP